jgi:crotonobetainyl-CoA:carnitine CoA-transferase CaiB-like acyl-CoA transferase
VSHRDELREALVQCLRPLLKAEVLQLLHEAGVPAGPVNDMAEAFELARSLGLDAVWQVDGVPQVRTPFRLSCDPPRPGAPGARAL